MSRNRSSVGKFNLPDGVPKRIFRLEMSCTVAVGLVEKFCHKKVRLRIARGFDLPRFFGAYLKGVFCMGGNRLRNLFGAKVHYTICISALCHSPVNIPPSFCSLCGTSSCVP
jgi:hypothetical protein